MTELEISAGEQLLAQALLGTAFATERKSVADLVYRKAVSPGGRPADDSSLAKTPEKDNWVDRAGGLPKYIRMVAHALIREHGFSTSRAIATAVTRMKVWAATSKDPKIKAAAAAAVAEWEAKRVRARAEKRLAAIDAARASMELEEKRERRVRTPEGARRFNKPIGSPIGGWRYMTPDAAEREWGAPKRRYTYGDGEHATLHESGDIVLSSGGAQDYEQDVYASFNDEEGEHLVQALSLAINGAAGWRPESMDEEREIDPETGWVEEFETPAGTRVGFDAVGDIGIVFRREEGGGPGEDEHELSNEEARALTNAIHSLVFEHRNGATGPNDDIFEDPDEGYELELDAASGRAYIPITTEALARRFGSPVGSSVWAPEEKRAPMDGIYFKRYFSTAQRREAARTGAALPDGSFPIYNEEDLSNARALVHQGRDPAAAAAHIAKRARELGLKSEGFPFPKGQPAGAEHALRRGTAETQVKEVLRRVRAPGGPWVEFKLRRVRTPEGSDFYGLPIGAPITADALNRVRGVPQGDQSGGLRQRARPDGASAAPYQRGMMPENIPAGKYTPSQIDEALDDWEGEGNAPIRHLLTTTFEDPYWQDTVDAIDSAMKPSARPVQGFVGVSDPVKVFGPSYPDQTSAEGMVFENPVYLPVSTNFRGATSKGKLALRISVPAGTPMVGMGDEDILLERGGRYEVVADHGYRDGVRQWDVAVLGENDQPKLGGLGVAHGSAFPRKAAATPAKKAAPAKAPVKKSAAKKAAPAPASEGPMPALSAMTVVNLRKLAASRGIKVPSRARKAEIIATIEGAAKPAASTPSKKAPVKRARKGSSLPAGAAAKPEQASSDLGIPDVYVPRPGELPIPKKYDHLQVPDDFEGMTQEQIRSIPSQTYDALIRRATFNKLAHQRAEAAEYGRTGSVEHDDNWTHAHHSRSDKRASTQPRLTARDKAAYKPGRWEVAEYDVEEAVRVRRADYVDKMARYYRDQIQKRLMRQDDLPEDWKEQAAALGEEDAREAYRDQVMVYRNGPHTIYVGHDDAAADMAGGVQALQRYLDDMITNTDPDRKVVVSVVPASDASGMGLVSYVGDQHIMLSASLFDRDSMQPPSAQELRDWAKERKSGLPDFKMPVGRRVPKLQYVLAHEWGHTIDYRYRDDEEAATDPRKQADDLYDHGRQGLSTYARTNPAEAYAEAFTEWYLNGGRQSDNPVVAAYARRFGWKLRSE